MSGVTGSARKMTDIHMHLIPGVDDGAADMEMALVMLLLAREQGIRKIIATPHSEAFLYGEGDIRGIFRRLANMAARVCPEIKLYLGCEVYCETGIMDQVLEALDSGALPTLNATRCVLMEFSQWVCPENTLPCVKLLHKAGYTPIIAHLERYQYLLENMALVDSFREQGALLQLNAYSLSDEPDPAVRNWARRLTAEGKADFLGTDAHRTYHRPPSAEHGLNWLYENADSAYADAITWGNAARLLFSSPE